MDMKEKQEAPEEPNPTAKEAEPPGLQNLSRLHWDWMFDHVWSLMINFSGWPVKTNL